MKQLFYTGIIAIVFADCASHSQTVTPGQAPLCISDSLARIIHIDTAYNTRVTDELNLSGEISFDDNKVVRVFPFSSGQVVQVNVSLGDKVVKGQTLAVIKSADVAGNYSDLSSAGNDVAIAKRNLANAQSLFESGIASEREFIEAKENYNKAMAAANKVKEQITINGGGNTTPNGTYIIKAPMSGYVVEKKLTQGSFIRNDNSDNLFTIGDIKDVWVWANVYESDIARVKEGYTAKVSTLAYPNTVFTGVVDKVNQILDPETKVMKIRIRLPNAGMQLKPEMFANITIQNQEGVTSTAIPATAVISDEVKNYVIVYHGKCNLELRPINLIKTIHDKAFIKDGIQPGEKVISQNQVLIYRALKES
jgi:cobalt-zinc-cadmium efflux system membrane fusion protein